MRILNVSAARILGAGRRIRPQGRLMLVTAGNATVQNEVAKYLNPSNN